MFDDGVERTTGSALPNLPRPETVAGRRSGNQSEPNTSPDIEFKPAWVYITYTLKTEDENTGKY